jgi:hypothetical protein
MSDEQSPEIQRLFAAADRELNDEAFVATAVAKAKAHSAKRPLIALAVCLVAAPVAWLVAPPLNTALLELTELVSQPIAAAGDSVANFIVLPIKTVGGAVVLGFLALRALKRRLLR